METTHAMVEIIPAVMPDTFEDVVSDVARVRTSTQWVQIDVMDGRLTQSISWPYAPGSTHFEALVADEEGLPFWEDVNYEVDLMILNPFVDAEQWIDAGVARIILHYKSLEHGNARELIERLRARGTEVVLALLPTDDPAILSPFADCIDGVQCMGITRVGFQGEPFEERVYALVREIRALYPEMPISIDGGVNDETAPRLVAAGATRLVSGSFIFDSEDAKASIAELQKISNV
jgi:ribulose-phosphate 3-epimerase